METIKVYDSKKNKSHEIPSNATHYIFGYSYGVYYKVGDNWIHRGDTGYDNLARDLNTDEYSAHHNQKIHVVRDFMRDKPVTEVDIDKECKERVGQVFGGLPVGESFISNGFIKKIDPMKGSGWRIGDGVTGRFVIADTKTDLDVLAEFVPDFTKHKDCDIAVIRDIVEQYRNKIKQLQESKK